LGRLPGVPPEPPRVPRGRGLGRLVRVGPQFPGVQLRRGPWAHPGAPAGVRAPVLRHRRPARGRRHAGRARARAFACC
jgi:hypothetical protein